MTELATALFLAVAIEGALYALFPAQMKSFMRQALGLPDGTLRWAGLIAALAAVGIIWFIRR